MKSNLEENKNLYFQQNNILITWTASPWQQQKWRSTSTGFEIILFFIKQLQTNLTSLSDESLFLQKYLDINYQTKFTYRSNMADFINLKTRGKSIFGACAREKLLLQEFGGGIYNDWNKNSHMTYIRRT